MLGRLSRDMIFKECSSLSRRSFLQVSALALGALAARSLSREYIQADNFPDEWEQGIGLGRVTVEAIEVRAEPSFNSERIAWLRQDYLVPLLEIIAPRFTRTPNRCWYRTHNGYIHSAYIQRVEGWNYQKPPVVLPGKLVLGEVSVPYVRAYQYLRSAGWKRLYRLYYHSQHWITAIEAGPDGEPWYRLRDDLLFVEYSVSARCLRIISWDEMEPLSQEVPEEEKRILISISDQTLTAIENDHGVRQFLISSGIPNRNLKEGDLPTDTPRGNFQITMKLPCRHMGDGELTNDIYAYELPGVPWTMIFHKDGYALHGTYWHNNFGRRMSHGCVNLPNDAARWLFRWTNPVYQPGHIYTSGRGTRVQIVD